MINNRLGWFLMELPALILVAYFILTGKNLTDTIILIAFILWMMHYINRTLIFPIRIKTKHKKMPVVIVAMAFFFNLINGFLNGYWLGILAPAYPENWLFDPRFIGGLFIFVAGFLINQYHDHLLIKLRKNNIPGYLIPKGGWFKFVSCPNLLGEIIEWAGFALITWSLPGFSFFVWTAVNLIPRALDHHRWYKSKFPDYPVDRKAVFPYIL
jgi:steroid 5-alpha reductase family enzyme